MQKLKEQQNQQYQFMCNSSAYSIHKRRLSDIQNRKASIPKLDKTFDAYKQNRYVAARKQEINRWEGIMRQNQKLLHKLNNVESSFHKSYSRQSIRSISSCNSRRSIELKENRAKENARMQIKLQKITSTFEQGRKLSPKNSGSAQKFEKIKAPQEKSLNVKPILNYKFQGQNYKRHRSLQQNNIPQQEIQKARNIISQYQHVLDQLLPILKQKKIHQ